MSPLIALCSNQQTLSGYGALHQLPTLLGHTAGDVLLFASPSFLASAHWATLAPHIAATLVDIVTVTHEASPQQLNDWVTTWRGRCRTVVAIGGGSTLDAGKAFSTLACHPLPAERYLEKIGDTALTAERLTFLAIPTTAGTGSEVTQNAVVTDTAVLKTKASLRHPNLVPDYAILDPALLRGTPAAVLANCGIDAFTHLFEAYLSRQANPLTRALSLTGLRLFVEAWPFLADSDTRGEAAREKMLNASWLGGLCLASAGLGVIHGIAGELGALKPWHHGKVCGQLLLPFFDRLAENENEAQQSLLHELNHQLFPLAQQQFPAQHLKLWITDNACSPFWQTTERLTPAQVTAIAERATNKYSLVDYSAADRAGLITRAWPEGHH
ncbi:iron-containing alcohol dehydrogenase [Rosenbergiella collisarenosi]|uniref:iron-containing alcohol dehydrogenase n=1 Tax=Rosenbergiella collisarenosi TaxID=1544695 RepID=UPI001BDB4724|nr:iron-containing alcohol dehydrogenase [Rosenbergiella collisarenosi]MBT0721178.1 iron-containing alcohol dehydrogenase [Rosenbergiella collisarenosi]